MADAPFTELSAEERGFVAGAALLGAPDEAADLLVEESGARCATAAAALRTQTREARAAALAGLLGPMVGGAAVEAVDPARVAESLAAEPVDLAVALALGLPVPLRRPVCELLRARGVDPAQVKPRPLSPEAAIELQRLLLARSA
jgi:hypothetical protein